MPIEKERNYILKFSGPLKIPARECVNPYMAKNENLREKRLALLIELFDDVKEPFPGTFQCKKARY